MYKRKRRRKNTEIFPNSTEKPKILFFKWKIASAKEFFQKNIYNIYYIILFYGWKI